MSSPDVAVKRLEAVSQELESRGQSDLARRIDEIVAVLKNGTVTEPSGGVTTTSEAAKLLGIRSINRVNRWAGDGHLEGVRRGGQIMVSLRSVERMLDSPSLSEQRAFEKRLDEALAPFDVGDMPIPETRAAWIGRKPWDQPTRTED